MYEAINIAMYIIDKCTSDSIPISNLQLQKILYFIQLNFLSMQDTVAFKDKIEAWQHGPVVPSVYDKFCSFGGTKIYMAFPNNRAMFNTSQDKEIVDKVIVLCRRINPWELVDITHKTGSPWSLCYNGYPTEIPINVIRDYAIRR